MPPTGRDICTGLASDLLDRGIDTFANILRMVA